ncbi:RNB domain-containing ribonuclease [Roseateles saccharophilus]|uniref:Exoribonuclease-2 n=1 Tax=Roseateles saccharophilus TaxID=304 RepID=A0A4R3VDQ5_ROSSA|nr:RNB domain-containing ribonuclease [Roseateles saccharophilus]MDG0832069.1 RNB domain-containing ribonuclease [Roseateles saccharophilus]TCV03477.1 exoribonuclease-2 [Roseateles saccharophilus]
MHNPRHWSRADLARIACDAMLERGLVPEFPAAVERELAALGSAAPIAGPEVADLRSLPWCSIDNDDSLDLDQLSACEPLADGAVRIFVAVADVDALVPRGSAIDDHARTNTTSVYTSARVFPMLPVRLSTDLSSLNPGQDRLALVTEMVVDAQGDISAPRVRRAWVHNRAKLAYDTVSAWLIGQGALPAAAGAVAGMDAQLRVQDETAQRLRARRHAQGSLEFETFQPRAVFDGDKLVDLRQQEHNRARQLIEELMIATNTCTARFLAEHGGASVRRVVRSPERWLRLVELAREYGESLPTAPDAKALQGFLARRHRADPLRFPDLSLVVIKLMGAGEYVVERPGAAPIGHFGLAERDYTHSTAPNRRYPDLITLRMMKALLCGTAPPYSPAELEALALHCTQQEDAARKVERRMRKSEAALFLAPLIGRTFDAVVTGHGDAGSWVRIFSPPAEGMLVGRLPALRVGQRLRVKLSSTDVERGFIDFNVAYG